MEPIGKNKKYKITLPILQSNVIAAVLQYSFVLSRYILYLSLLLFSISIRPESKKKLPFQLDAEWCGVPLAFFKCFKI